MTVGGLDRERLARIVKRERTSRGLSVREAARLAGVDRDTWTGVENATRLTRDGKAALMEPVVGMGPGSFEAVLAGGDPTPIQMEKPPLTEKQQAVKRTYLANVRDRGPDEAFRILLEDIARLNAEEVRQSQTGEHIDVT